MTTPFILTLAPNGARRGKRDHPRLPVSREEIAREAAALREAGAAMLHLHVRDGEGRHILDADAYLSTIDAIRREVGPDLIVQITTEAVGLYGPEQQMACVDAVAPEAVSIALRELAPDAEREAEASAFLERHARRGALLQYIVYDVADLERFEQGLKRGWIPRAQASPLYVLGRYAPGQRSAPADLLPFLSARTDGLPWSVCAFGPREAAVALAAAALDGHARVGFENNLHLPDGSLAPDNAALARAVSEALPATGRRLATPGEARAIFSGR